MASHAYTAAVQRGKVGSESVDYAKIAKCPTLWFFSVNINGCLLQLFIFHLDALRPENSETGKVFFLRFKVSVLWPWGEKKTKKQPTLLHPSRIGGWGREEQKERHIILYSLPTKILDFELEA